MPFTRAQAESLLNQRELALFNDSRINSLRRLDVAGLERRIVRTREARDRARDLLRRQKLASRARTGSKRGASGNANQRTQRKAELLADVLQRFQAQLPAARRREREQAAAAKKAARPATRRAARPAKRAARATAPVTPRRALTKTRKLLEAKQARDREPPSWPARGGRRSETPQPGYQSAAAARKAQELHAAESRMASIHGSISTRDRHGQGKRDHREDGD